MKKPLNLSLNVVRKLILKFGAIWIKGVKRSLRIINEKVTLFRSICCKKVNTKIWCNLDEECKKVLKDN